MNIVFASSEVAPFAKTGGLADVCGALPAELARQGHNVSVLMPAYRSVLQLGSEVEPLNHKFDIPIGNKIVRGRLLKGVLPAGVPVYFVDQPEYFDRPELYRVAGEDYPDNCERFVFFCRAVLEAVRLLKLTVDLVHCHDWQTALIPAYLKAEYAHAQGYESIASLFTIHNLAYQGVFPQPDMNLTGLDWKFFNMHQMEFYGKLNLLKTGVIFADGLTTVSQTYAEEIQSAQHGCGLDGALRERREALEGIVNGVDYGVWNSATDKQLAATYKASNWQAGKAANKAALQDELGLPKSPRTPLIGLIGRLADQKGWDLVAEVMQRWAQQADVQWAILGTGEQKYQGLLQDLGRRFPQKVAPRFEFCERLAHRIEAAADIFLMPSQYEPCGLNQLYSLRYGAVPVVRATGGLADTVADANEKNLAGGVATGFSFEHYESAALETALSRAVSSYHHQPEVWNKLVAAGMAQDWSWAGSARKYAAAYQRAMQRHAEERARLLGQG